MRSNEVELAQRRYQAVEPTHRLVAATLERDWEQALREQQQLQEDYERFQQHSPAALSEAERLRILHLASDIPALWHSPQTTNKERQAIVRCVLERVIVQVPPTSEYVEVTLQWMGGHTTHHQLVRPVATYAQLRDFEGLMARVTALRQAGHTAVTMAAILNAEGFTPPKRDGGFTTPVVYQLLKRCGLIGNERVHPELLGPDEWWVADLARELGMSYGKLRDWARRGWIHGRQTPVQGYWIMRADACEITRLRQLLASSRRGVNGYTAELTTPTRGSPRKP